MVSPVRAVWGLSLFVTLAGCASRPGGLSEQDVAALKQLGLTWGQSIVACDWDRAMTIYADDAIRLGEYPPIRGRKAIRQWLGSTPCGGVRNFSVTNIEVLGKGDLAVVWDSASVQWVGSDKTAAHPVDISENYLAVVRRQPNGSWLIIRDMWKSDVPFSDPTSAAASPTLRKN
jgi:ketosteroid isomerase-like protein